MLSAKCDKYGRDLTIVDRWYPSSQICSCCGQSGGKKELDVREWECLYCNTIHDRDINAAENLNRWAGGQSDQDSRLLCGKIPTQNATYKYGRRASVSLPVLKDTPSDMVAVCGEASTTPKQLTL